LCHDRARKLYAGIDAGAMEAPVALLLIILIILLLGGAGLLTFIVKSFIAAGIVGIIALALIIYLLLVPRRA
jgi:hypothetical protein